MSLKYELETAEDEIRTAFQVFDKVLKFLLHLLPDFITFHTSYELGW